MEFSKVKLQLIRDKDFSYNAKIIKSPADIAEYITDIEQLHTLSEEIMILICLGTKNQIICYSEIAKGGIDYCNVDLKTIFKTVLLCNANKFILVHNHPSGVAHPSHLDFVFTHKVTEASNVLNIKFLDHVIVGENNFISLKKFKSQYELNK